MTDTVEQHITKVVAAYKPLVSGDDSRLVGGSRLWGQFKDAVAAYRRHGMEALPAIIEQPNKLANLMGSNRFLRDSCRRSSVRGKGLKGQLSSCATLYTLVYLS